MKTAILYFVLCFSVFAMFGANAQTWDSVGNAGFSAGTVKYTSIAIDTGGTPYVVYEDGSNGDKATVMKYSGGNWVTVGSAGFSAGVVSNTSLAIDRNGIPYVAYSDSSNGGKATVMKYNGTGWVTVGSADFSADQAGYIYIAINNTGTPYVVYMDYGNSQKATVMKYNGTAWVTVGSAGFSASEVQYTSIAIDNSGTPYVVYGDVGSSFKATVMKYNGSNWVTVGSAGFSAAVANWTFIAIDNSGKPYVVYSDGANDDRATVMQYNGSSWVTTGSAGFSAGPVLYSCIAIDQLGTPYVVYSVGGIATVMKYNGSSWVMVGGAGISAGLAQYTSIAINAGSIPYVAYEDYVKGNKATVMTLKILPISGNNSVCVGDTATLSDPSPGGIWSSSNTAIATVGGSTGTVAGIATGTVTISYTISGILSTAFFVTVNPLPDAGIINGLPTVCADATMMLSDAASGGTWSCTNTNAGITVTGLVTGNSTGVDTVNYSVTNSCGTAIATKTILVLPVAVVTAINGSSSVCPGSTIIVTDTTSGGTWSVNNGDASVSATGVVTGISAGTDIITYSVTNTCGTSIATTTITVDPLPDAGTISGPASVCAGATINLTDAVSGGSWSHSNFNAVVSAFSGVVTGLAAGADTIFYTVTGTCSASATWVVSVDVAATAITTTALSFNVCIGGIITLSDAVTGGTWSSSNTNASVSGSGVVTGITPGVDTITYDVLNACGHSGESIAVMVDHWPLVYIVSGGGSYCEGGTGVSIGLSGSDIGISYLLYYGSSVTGYLAGTGSALIFDSLTVAGTYTVLASTLAGCTSNMSDSAVVIITPTVNPAVSVIASTGDTVCPGTTVTLIPVPDSGGTSPAYQWSVNGVLVSLGNTYTFIPADSDVISVTMTSDGYCVTPLTASGHLAIHVLPWGNPAVSMSIDPGDTVCEFSLATFTAAPKYGGPTPGYAWYVNGADEGSGPEYSYYPATGDTVYCKITSDYLCRSSPDGYSNAVVMTVLPTIVPHVEITGTPGFTISVNENDTLFAVVTDAGANPTYQWEVNGIPVYGATSSTLISQFNDYDSVTCIVTSSGACNDISAFDWVFITVYPLGVQQYAAGGGDIKLIPNPNKGSFTISGALGTITNEEVSLEITDMLGQVVYRNNVMINDGKINEQVALNNTLANGMYLLNLRSGSDNRVFHFVVQR